MKIVLFLREAVALYAVRGLSQIKYLADSELNFSVLVESMREIDVVVTRAQVVNPLN